MKRKVGENVEQSDGERLLNIKEVAERLGCGTTTVRALIRERSLPAVKIRSAVRVRSEDLSDFVRKHRF